jgi:hypothetical protein
MVLICDLSVSKVEIIGNSVKACNTSQNTPAMDPLAVIGRSTQYAIAINDSQLKLFLPNVDVTSRTPLVIQASYVVLVTEGSNQFRISALLDYSAIECAQSNVIVTSIDGVWLSVDGGESDPGIEVIYGWFCTCLWFTNSSVSASGHPGIGPGWHGADRRSETANVTISNSAVVTRAWQLALALARGMLVCLSLLYRSVVF